MFTIVDWLPCRLTSNFLAEAVRGVFDQRVGADFKPMCVLNELMNSSCLFIRKLTLKILSVFDKIVMDPKIMMDPKNCDFLAGFYDRAKLLCLI